MNIIFKTLLLFLLTSNVGTVVAADANELFREGMKFYRDSDYAKAERYFRHVLKRDPAHEEANLLLSNMMLSQDRFDEGMKVLDQAAEQSAGDKPNVLLTRGIMLREKGDTKGATAAYLKAAEMGKDDPLVLGTVEAHMRSIKDPVRAKEFQMKKIKAREAINAKQENLRKAKKHAIKSRNIEKIGDVNKFK